MGLQKGSVILTCLNCRGVYYINVPGKGIQDIPGSWIPCHGFRILDTGFRIIYQWNLDSGFFELYSGFQSPGFLILQAKIFRIPEPRFPSGANCTLFFVYKNVVFQVQDEYSFFSVDFRLIIFLNYSNFSGLRMYLGFNY